MDMMTSPGGMIGQFAAGLAGLTGATVTGVDSPIAKMARGVQKPTIDSLPDKVGHFS
jgi:hypothetical protein